MAEIHPIERIIKIRAFIVPVHWVMQIVLSGTFPTNKLTNVRFVLLNTVILSVIAGWEWLYAGEDRGDGARGGGGGGEEGVGVAHVCAWKSNSLLLVCTTDI